LKGHRAHFNGIAREVLKGESLLPKGHRCTWHGSFGVPEGVREGGSSHKRVAPGSALAEKRRGGRFKPPGAGEEGAQPNSEGSDWNDKGGAATTVRGYAQRASSAYREKGARRH